MKALRIQTLTLLAGTVVCIVGQIYEEFEDEVSILQTELRVRKGGHAISSNSHASETSAHDQSKSMDYQYPTSTTLPPKETVDTGLPWVFAAAGLFGVAYLFARWSEDSSGWSKYVAEFVGTFMLVFAIGCNAFNKNAVSMTWSVTSVAFTLMVSMYALGPISGANFNPAVSLALALSNKLPWVEALVYVHVQLAAGVCGGIAYGSFIGQATSVGPSSGHTGWQAGVAELLYTFLLTFVFLNTVASKKSSGQNEYYPVAIAFALIAGGYGAGNISGGCFNPAVALGKDASAFSLANGWCFAYWVFELMGGGLAAVMLRHCRPEVLDESGSSSSSDSDSDKKGSSSSDKKDDEEERMPQAALIREFLGTYFLVLTVGLNVLTHSRATTLSIAACFVSVIYALGSSSGGYFNPAVTLAIACSGRNYMKPARAIHYILVQIFAGTCGAFTYMLLMNGKTVALTPAPGASTQALVGELIFTFLLCFVVLSVATGSNQLEEYFGLAIGASVIAGGVAMAPISGGSLNPAVSAGLAFTDSTNGGTLEHFVSYTSVQLLAGAFAALIFRKTHVAEYPKEIN